MNEIKPVIGEIDERYELVEDKDGILRCSCGREMIKSDEETYTCSGGFPSWRVSDDDLFIDKFGNVQLKHKEH